MARGINRAADPVICAGDAAIAVIIYEKVFMFASMDRDFLSRYQFLAMDEIGLTQDVSRGMKADFILVRASPAFEVAPSVRTGGSRHAGQAAPPHRNNHAGQDPAERRVSKSKR